MNDGRTVVTDANKADNRIGSEGATVPAWLRPLHYDDGSVRGGRIAALGALVGLLVVLASLLMIVSMQAGKANAVGVIVLVMLFGFKLPALAMLFAVMSRHLRGASPVLEADAAREIESLNARLAEAKLADAPRGAFDEIAADAWAFADRAPGHLGGLAADIALAAKQTSKEASKGPGKN